MIVPETLEQIANAVTAQGGAQEQTLAHLKARWPDLRFTRCSEDDMPARLKPALRRQGFSLYLVGGGEHCLTLIEDPLHAIGIVIADMDEETQS